MVTQMSRSVPVPRSTRYRPDFPIKIVNTCHLVVQIQQDISDVAVAEESDLGVVPEESDLGAVAEESDVAVVELREETLCELHADHLDKISRKAAEEFETDFDHVKSRIHRFPAGLRGLGSRYIVPKVVYIGPYHRHRGLDHLKEMEKVKQVAAYHFVLDSKFPYKTIYGEVLSLAGAARSLYVNDGVASTISDVEFAEMMFLDGCFLLQYMKMFSFSGRQSLYSSLVSCFDSNQHCISNDIMLLENQLPWVVLETISQYSRPAGNGDVLYGIAKMGRTLELRGGETYRQFQLGEYTPPHLLGLLRFYKTGSNIVPREGAIYNSVRPVSKTIGAVELAEVGIKLTSSKTTKFRDMGMKKTPLFGQMFVVPLLLDEIRSCWLGNMLAYEVCIVTDYSSDPELPVVCSYLALLAMLMDREEDVHELRSRRLVQGELTNRETLEFFKSLVKHISGGPLYTEILEEIEEYKSKRWMWIKVHTFFYKKFKIICAMLSIIGVLVGIFKALFSVNLSTSTQKETQAEDREALWLYCFVAAGFIFGFSMYWGMILFRSEVTKKIYSCMLFFQAKSNV